MCELEDEYTDLEKNHIDSIVKTIKKKYSSPKINNLCPLYRDMVIDLQNNCNVRTCLHKKVVTVGALKKIFHSNDPIKNRENIKLIKKHENDIEHLLYQSHSKKKEETCYRCRQSCLIS